jgi:hypothetical protein
MSGQWWALWWPPRLCSRPHADGLACAVWPQLATSAVWRKVRGAGAKLTSRSSLIAETASDRPPRRPPVSLVLGCLTTCLGLFGGAAPGAFGLVVGVVVGAAGHQGKQGPSDLVAGGGQGGLGVLVPGEGAGSVAVSPASRLTPDAGCQVQGRPSPQAEPSGLMPSLASVAPDGCGREPSRLLATPWTTPPSARCGPRTRPSQPWRRWPPRGSG